MSTYDHLSIEKKWQARWKKEEQYKTENSVEGKDNEYLLSEFPYPSGDLHIGHWYAFAVPDIYARFRRMQGKNVLYPIGFDAFGLPAENAAIKRGLDPRKWTYDNIRTMTTQLESMGNSFDWSRKIVTSDPEYYQWTQWLFLQLLAKGLAYKKKSTVPWCDSCKTVLANEQIVQGACERCGTAVVQKELAQWFFKITDYAERLLSDLDTLPWSEEIKQAQREWIGKSEGAEIRFAVCSRQSAVENVELPVTANCKLPTANFLSVFTTRPDTLFGVTYVVLAPEHPLVAELKDQIENWDEVSAYIEKTAQKKELERKEGKEKTGVPLKGVFAINPANQEYVPVWIADYVLANYGTGAVMAVPAHDERDWEFAKKYELPIRQVIAPLFVDTEGGKDAVRPEAPTVRRKTAFVLLKHWSEEKYLCLDWEKFDWHSGIIGGIEEGETPEEAGKREVAEETGYKNFVFVKTVLGEMHSSFYAAHKEVNRYAEGIYMLFQLKDDAWEAPSEEETKNHKTVWIETKDMETFLNLKNFQYIWDVLSGKKSECFTGDGVLISSDTFSGMPSEEAKRVITEHVGGKMTTQHRLRDWLLSRQRFWGCPIPVVYDPEGKPHPVPEEHLPWLLPEDADFKPTGEAPLASSQELRDRTEKIFGKGWTPEIDTMDTFVDSSWYFLRYLDAHNNKAFASTEAQKAWMPVTFYSGGAEHTTMHLLYSRFFHKALFDCGLVADSEPYAKRMNRGLILGPDGHKMSKSKGNVINPDEHVARVGADTVKMYLAFIGPYAEVGQYPWDLGGIAGIRRFLERVWNMGEKINPTSPAPDGAGQASQPVGTSSLPPAPCPLHPLDTLLAQTIQKVTEDTLAFKFNTAISALMILVNALEKEPRISPYAYETLIRLLAPFAPHLTEELWEKLGHTTSVHKEPWPKADETVLRGAVVSIAIQINGKVRGVFTGTQNTTKEQALEEAQKLPTIAERLKNARITREIYVQGRMLSLVVENP